MANFKTGADYVRSNDFSIEFSPFSRESIVRVPNGGNDEILDVLLSVQCGLTGSGLAVPVPTSSPDDVHLYIVGPFAGGESLRDLTPFFVGHIRSALDRLDQSDLKRRYQYAMDRALALWRGALREFQYGENSLIQERRNIEAILATEPLSNTFQKIGDRRYGLQGRLHISNFLLSDIVVPPASLRALLVESNLRNRTAIEFSEIESVRLMVTHGPYRMVDANWESQPQPSGLVRLYLESVAKNKLADEVSAFESLVKEQLEGVVHDLSLGGDLQQLLGKTHDILAAVLNELADTKKTQAELKAQQDGILKQVGLLLQRISTPPPVPTPNRPRWPF